MKTGNKPVQEGHFLLLWGEKEPLGITPGATLQGQGARGVERGLGSAELCHTTAALGRTGNGSDFR